MKTLLFLLGLLLPTLIFAKPLKIEENTVLKTIIQEMTVLGSSPEIYHLSEQYRLDLTLNDLVDQVTVIALKHPGLNEKLKAALGVDQGGFNFKHWLETLKLESDTNSSLHRELERKLSLQFYSPRSIALLPHYKFFDLKKIKDNALLARIGRYNRWANDSEAQGFFSAFEARQWAPFYTRSLTVAKLKSLKEKELKKLHRSYYQTLIKLYTKLDPTLSYYHSKKKGLRVYSSQEYSGSHIRLFKHIQRLPTKHQLLFALAQYVPTLPYENGMYLLPVSFIKANYDAIFAALKEITLDQIIESNDERYLLNVRNYIQDHAERIQADVQSYNATHEPDLQFSYQNRNRKPRRLEAIANLNAMLTLYPEAPWFKRDHGDMLDHRGREIFLENRGRRFLQKIGYELIQTETYLSILGGTATLIMTQGNIPIAMSTKKLIKTAIETQRYDKEWEEFVKNAPREVLESLLMGAGFGPGRVFKIIALGAGQGFLQSLFTGQDLRTGAMVGAGLNLIQFYILPAKIARPMTDGFDAKSLAMNRRLEMLEKTIRSGIHGATVAALTGEDILKGSLKGAVYGAVSTQLMIWFLGTRYNPFKDYSDADVDEMIRLENEFQNFVGRGGHYEINRQLILDANFRVGGALPKMITASITLPGNVAMGDQGFRQLTTLTHEAHHLMQQHQSGVFGFYLLRYIPTAFKTGYNGHPDENFLSDIL